VTEVTWADVAKIDPSRPSTNPLRCQPVSGDHLQDVYLAEIWGLRQDGTNPRKHIKKYPEEKRERFELPFSIAAKS
jgi:hypothetical protein